MVVVDGHFHRRGTIIMLRFYSRTSSSSSFSFSALVPSLELTTDNDTDQQLIPADFTFDPNANPPCFTSTEDTVRVFYDSIMMLLLV